MKNLIKELVRSLLRKHPQLAVKIGRFFGGKYQVNINLDLLNSQQKKNTFMLSIFGGCGFDES